MSRIPYIEQQHTEFTAANQWGSLLCRDLQQMLLHLLMQDADVRYIISRWRSLEYCRQHNRIVYECLIAHVTDSTRLDLCVMAVECSYITLLFIENQREDICLAAINAHRYLDDVLWYIRPPYQTERVCLQAVQNIGANLQWTANQTEEICLAAVLDDWTALQFVKDQTEKVCLVAVNKAGYALSFVQHQTDSVCMAAVRQNGWALQFVHNQTRRIIEAALENDPTAIQCVREK